MPKPQLPRKFIVKKFRSFLFVESKYQYRKRSDIRRKFQSHVFIVLEKQYQMYLGHKEGTHNARVDTDGGDSCR